MEDTIKIKDLNDRELLEFVFTNQIVMQQKIERIYNHLKQESPKSQALIGWRHYDEIFDDLLRKKDDVERQVNARSSSE